MFLQKYEPHELSFAFCYRLYASWMTKSRKPVPQLALLNNSALAEIALPLGVHVLESFPDISRLALMVSLTPKESVSSCVSKLKGGVTKWLRLRRHQEVLSPLLSRGYFAKTIGKNNDVAVRQYLDEQPRHHGYANRILPPVFTKSYPLKAEDIARLSVAHAIVEAQFHIVLATSYRFGFFGAASGSLIASAWQQYQTQLRFALIKVSVVPDHVHLAVQTHAAVSPATLVAELMNIAQDAVQKEQLVQAQLDRLWQPSAYIGSFGNLTTPQIRKYLENLTQARNPGVLR